MVQSRKKFLKHFLIGATSVPLILEACKKDAESSSSSSGSTGNSSSQSCTVTPTETAGPYPTHDPATLEGVDIRMDRTGVLCNIKITVKNTNADCANLAGAIVDVWHCDKDGNYSEYGSVSSLHFLRGRQTTDANGQVSFTSIFPGWYNGRTTHIHVHIYNKAGTTLLITQIAFPEGSVSAVATVNGSDGVAYGYTKGMSGYTYNAQDGIFADDKTGSEIAVVTGAISTGYTVDHVIRVAA